MADAGVQVVIGTTATASTSLQSYATDGAFVAAKGSAAADGDIYYNTTSDAYRAFQDGAWNFLRHGPLLSFATDALFVTAKGSAAGNGDQYYNTTEHVVRRYENSAWISAFKTPGRMGTSFIGLAAATTTNANDSIRILASDGSALSSEHMGYVVVPATAAGTLSIFPVTANVTINITGAHWGLGTLGDFSDIILRVYAINDAGTLKWGVSNKGGLRSITVAASSVTATDINTQPEMLVNTALSGTSACMEVGWFLADFDDAGGAAEDLWAVQTGAGEIMVGRPAPVYTDWESVTMTCGLTGGTTVVSALRQRCGDTTKYRVDPLFSTVFTGGSATFTMPTGDVMDTSKLAGTAVAGTTPLLGHAFLNDIGSDVYPAYVYYNATNQILVRGITDDAGAGGLYVNCTATVSTTVPFTWANNDRMSLNFEVPVRGWSNN